MVLADRGAQELAAAGVRECAESGRTDPQQHEETLRGTEATHRPRLRREDQSPAPELRRETANWFWE